MIKQYIAVFWGGRRFEYAFYACLVIILILERDRKKRQLFFWYPALVYAFLCSPLYQVIGERLWGNYVEAVAYYARQYSLVPVFFVMAYAVTILVKRFPSVIRLFGVLVISLAMAFFGSFTYKIDYSVSENVYKIPNEAIVITDWVVTQGEDIVLATPMELSHYIRQYNPDVHMITHIRDNVSDVPTNLGSYNPDVEFVMSRCCDEGCNFAVALNDTRVREAYANCGYEPCLETENYLVFACEGYVGYWKTYNNSEQVVSRKYHDASMRPSINEGGYHESRNEYNRNGWVTRTTYYDLEQNLILNASGFADQRNEYDKKGRIIRSSFYDNGGNPTAIPAGYASIAYERDDKNRSVREYYFGIDGKPYTMDAGYFGCERVYDEAWRVIRLTYLDANGKPYALENGYVTETYEYDGEGSICKVMYLDAAGNLAERNGGYSGYKQNLDKYGCKTWFAYLNSEGKPIAVGDQLQAITTSEYNSRHQLIKESYFDAEGMPIRSTAGYASIVYERDAAGNVTQEYYYDENGKNLALSDGCFGIHREYDGQNRVIKSYCTDENGTPSINDRGYCMATYTYDENNCMKQEMFYDVEGTPVALQTGQYGYVWTYDNENTYRCGSGG